MSEHMGLTTPTREQAERWLADTGILGHLEVAEVTPGGEKKPRWLASLLDLVEFLVPLDENGRLGDTVNFADPNRVIAWVRDDICDPELAGRMDQLVDGRMGYTRLAPLLRELALARVIQCWELLKKPEPPAE